MENSLNAEKFKKVETQEIFRKNFWKYFFIHFIVSIIIFSILSYFLAPDDISREMILFIALFPFSFLAILFPIAPEIPGVGVNSLIKIIEAIIDIFLLFSIWIIISHLLFTPIAILIRKRLYFLGLKNIFLKIVLHIIFLIPIIGHWFYFILGIITLFRKNEK